jgi:hypothetical protein
VLALPFKKLFALFFDFFSEVFDLLFHPGLQVFEGTGVVAFLVFDLCRKLFLFSLGFLERTLQELKFLLKESLLLVEFRFSSKSSTLDFLLLLFLGRYLIASFIKLSGRILTELFDSFGEFRLNALSFLAHLSQGFAEGLLLSQSLSALSLQGAELGLEEINTVAGLLLLLFELIM